MHSLGLTASQFTILLSLKGSLSKLKHHRVENLVPRDLCAQLDDVLSFMVWNGLKAV